MIETLFPPHDALIWKSFTVVILAMSALAILYFLIQIGEGLQVVWTDDLLPWWREWRRQRRITEDALRMQEQQALRRAVRQLVEESDARVDHLALSMRQDLPRKPHRESSPR